MLVQEVSARRGFDMYGDKSVDVMRQEYQQMVKKDVFGPVNVHDLDENQKRGSLRVVNLVKQKRSGDIKGRMCGK